MIYLYLFLGLVLFLPLFVVALEYNHYWTKLYNWWVSSPICVSGYAGKAIHYKSEPNTKEHQLKMYIRWLIIGFVLFFVISLICLFV